MRFNRKRHLLLEKLSEKFIAGTDNSKTNLHADIIGLNFSEIDSLLKVSKAERELVLSELDKNKEIVFFDLKEEGCFIDTNGLAALTDKKYKKKNEDIIINWFKVFVQIIVPILALLVAVLSLTTKFDSLKKQSDKELQKINTIIQEQKVRIEKLERKTKTLPNRKINDSV